MIDKICEKTKCTACFACENACPAGAIRLEANENGAVYPVISEACTECGLCQRICPAENQVALSEPKAALAFYSKDSEIRKSSTSGGLIYSACQSFDGIIYGAAFTKNLDVEHIRIENKRELKKTQGSKYVHSFVNLCYRSVKEDLDCGKRVLFTGTPCQIAGLKAYLKKDCPLLYTIDFVCHGVCDSETLKAYIKNEFPALKSENARVRFRDEKGYHMTVWDGEEYIGEIPFNQNFYLHGFLEGWSLRENCHSCRYSGIRRCSDLTACDCWVSDNGEIKAEMKRGLNGVLINTEKGQELLDSVKDGAVIIESSVEEAQSGIVHLRHPSPHTELSKRFSALNKKRGAYYALKNTVLKKKIVFRLRKIKNARNSNN